MGSARMLVVLCGVVLTSSACTASEQGGPAAVSTTITGSRAAMDRNVAFVTQDWPTDWSNSVVGLEEFILGVGATQPRDSIPPIDDPQYESIQAATEWLSDREPGAVVSVNGETRFFPLSIMNRHEIVNDEIGGVPLAVTYCPLCNTALAFDRRVNGNVLRFGVSGLLRNSDLVMWDDQTVSLWQQATGEGLVGEFAGTRLEAVTTAIVSFGEFRESFPDQLSLSQDTGFDLTYGTNPYEGYSGRFTPLMPVLGEPDHRFLPMERVVGLSAGGVDKAYPFSVLAGEGAVNDVVGGEPVVVLWGSPDTADPLNGRVVAESRAIGTAVALSPVVNGDVLTLAPSEEGFTDAQTGSTWTVLGTAIAGPLTGSQLAMLGHRNDFWFAWTAFFPDAEVYE